MKNNVISCMLFSGITFVSSPLVNAGNFYSFGDSLTDNGISVRRYGGVLGNSLGRYPGADGKYTNGQTWAEVLPKLTGLNFEDTNGYAIGGARTGYQGNEDALTNIQTGFLAQIDNFRADLLSNEKSLGRNDVVGIWIGTNDIFQDFSDRALDSYISNIQTGILRLESLGASNFIVIGSDDISLLAKNSDTPDPYLQTVSAASHSFNDKLLSMNIPEVNIYYFDVLTLLRNVVTDPSAYGFTYFTDVDNCEANQCDTLSFEEQNTYLMKDAIHYTDRFERLIASYIANIINARNTLQEQVSMSSFGTDSFVRPLLDRYNLRALSGPSAMNGSTSRWHLFVNGGTSRGVDRFANPDVGLDLDKGRFSNDSITLGIDYQISNEWIVGAALNYANLDSKHADQGGSNTGLTMIQGAVFASYANTQDIFGSVALSYGVGEFDISRAGVMQNLHASPDSTALSAAMRLGKWYRFSAVDLAPVADLAYSKSSIDSYRESGDSLLEMGVHHQSYETLNGSLGGQLAKAFKQQNINIESLIRVTAEHPVIANDRTIQSFQLNAPNFVIRTPIEALDNQTYGRINAQLQVGLPSGLGFNISATSTVGRSQDETSIMMMVEYPL